MLYDNPVRFYRFSAAVKKAKGTYFDLIHRSLSDGVVSFAAPFLFQEVWANTKELAAAQDGSSGTL